MDTSDTSSVLWAIVQNDGLIYEKACSAENKQIFTKQTIPS